MFKSRFMPLVSKMVSFRTTAGAKSEIKKIISFVLGYFAGTGAVIMKFIKNGTTSLVISNLRTKNFDILYCAHLDVVPAEDSQFKMTKRSGKIFGRGVADDKGEAAIGMMILKDILEKNIRSDLKIGLLLTTDEEIGGDNGAAYLARSIKLRSKVILLPDGGEDYNLVQASKGLFHLELTARGKESHGSRPWFGDNAVEKLIGVFEEVKKMFPQKATARNYWQNTLNIGKFNGGKVINQVPSLATMGLDIRYTDNFFGRKIMLQFKNILRKNKGVSITNLTSGEMMFLDISSIYVKKMQQAAKAVLGRPLKVYKESAATDGHFFSSRGMDVLVFAPKMGNIHGLDEWLDLKSAEKFYKLIGVFIEKF